MRERFFEWLMRWASNRLTYVHVCPLCGTIENYREWLDLQESRSPRNTPPENLNESS